MLFRLLGGADHDLVDAYPFGLLDGVEYGMRDVFHFEGQGVLRLGHVADDPLTHPPGRGRATWQLRGG